MRIPLQSPAGRIFLLAASLLGAAAYTGFAAVEYLAAHFSQNPDLISLQRAARLQPGNAEYPYRVARYFSLVERSPEEAVQAYRAAVGLNPHQSRYWLDLAAAYQLLGNLQEQTDALEHALKADPTTPDVAWEAANFYLIQGETEKAMREFRVVLANDLPMVSTALQLCWRINPDVDALLNGVVPANQQVYFAFLDLLMAKKETAGAAKVWAQLSQSHQPLGAGHVFDYIRYLVGQREVDQAGLVWRQAATRCGLAAYQQSPGNLVVNGDFSLDVLNGGFDWLYHKSPDVALALDPTQFHTGHRSLSIVFNSRGIEDAGIRQLVLVQPNATYEFSANFKTEDLQGAGGPRFALQDLFDGTTYFASDELKDAGFWKPVSGGFTTGPQTKLLVLRVQRVPPGAIRGKLWIDGVRLVQTQPGEQR
jgi:hypothetical protein